MWRQHMWFVVAEICEIFGLVFDSGSKVCHDLAGKCDALAEKAVGGNDGR